MALRRTRPQPRHEQSALQPLRIGNLELTNRIIIAPMCQYLAEAGKPGDWHLIEDAAFGAR